MRGGEHDSCLATSLHSSNSKRRRPLIGWLMCARHREGLLGSVMAAGKRKIMEPWRIRLADEACFGLTPPLPTVNILRNTGNEA